MKIRSNVKAGGITMQHNEKLADCNSNSIEQKKSFSKKLRLNKETIRQLKDGDMKLIVGGAIPPFSERYNCTESCQGTCITCGHGWSCRGNC